MADPEKNQGAVELGRKGGLARANKQTPEQRSRIAQRGGQQRWKGHKKKEEPIQQAPDDPVVTPKEEGQPEPFFEDGEWWIKKNGCYQSVSSPKEEIENFPADGSELSETKKFPTAASEVSVRVGRGRGPLVFVR
jgi:hypothetical protein